MRGSARIGFVGTAIATSSAPTRLFAAAIGMFLFITLLAAGGAAVSTSAACGPKAPSSELVGDLEGVPKELIPIYQDAAAKYSLGERGPSILAAINKVETDFGKNVAESSAGAQGWMQFMPATWAGYGVDGDGDGEKDWNDPDDAIFSAANYLRASGAPGNWHDAIFAYNHAEWYVEEVLGYAEQFSGATSSEITAPTSTTQSTGPSQSVSGVSKAYAEFSELVSAESGLSLRVVAAWTLAEGGPDDNPLNIGPGKQYGDIAGAAEATVEQLNTSPYRGVMASIDGTDSEQIAAIVASPWCGGGSGCRGSQKLLDGTYDRVKVSVRPRPPATEGCEAPAAAGGGQIGSLGEGNPDPIALARNPRVILTDYAKQDLLAYHVSPKLVAVLDAGSKLHEIGISVFSTGHSLGSNHIPGRAADITSVDGEACLAESLGREGPCWDFAQELGAIEDKCYRSTELIYFFDPSPAPDHWAASDHDDHIHLGWNGLGTSSVFTYLKGTDPCSPEAINGG